MDTTFLLRVGILIVLVLIVIVLMYHMTMRKAKEGARAERSARIDNSRNFKVVKVAKAKTTGKANTSGVATAGQASGARKEGFALVGETYPPIQPRIDVFDDETIGSEIAAKYHTAAFEKGVNDHIRSLRLSEPEVVRERIAENLFLWAGDYKGREEIQSNPFVKVAINNPSELKNTGLESTMWA